jgi:hypothetical protein
MRSRYLLSFLLLLFGVIFLTACLPGTDSQPAEQPSIPETIEGEDSYPGPDIAQPAPDDAYPAPPSNPYPGVILGENGGDTTVFLAREIVPLPSDENLIKGSVYINESEVVMNESLPAGVGLVLKGDLPTPCNALRVVVSKPDDQGYIELEVYSVVDADRVCVQVLSPFETVIPLGSFSGGTYTLGINGEAVNEFEIP